MKHYFKLIFSTVPKLSVMLSDSTIRAISLAMQIYVFLCIKKVFKVKQPKTFNFIFNGKLFTLTLQNPLDISALGEIYVQKEYELNLPFKVHSVLDLGAHWGDTATYFSLLYPDAKIYAVEPDPNVYQRLKDISSTYKNIIPFQLALAGVTGQVDFYANASSLGSSLIKRNNNDKVVSVHAVTVADLCQTIGIQRFDLVKFDVEGGEIHLLQSGLEKVTKAFIGEIHHDLVHLSDDVIKALTDKFDITKVQISPCRELWYGLNKNGVL
jgi:FkbM family methyltransferase